MTVGKSETKKILLRNHS
jgi:hypothetical protein